MNRFDKNIEFSGDGGYVRFIPVANVPGYTHRVVLLDHSRRLLATDWLTKGTRITHKVAEYYYDKHCVFDTNSHLMLSRKAR